MLTGTLTINLNPPYLAFQAQSNDEGLMRSCSIEEIKLALTEFGDREPQAWPLKECLVRMPGQFSRAKLTAFGLIPAPVKKHRSG